MSTGHNSGPLNLLFVETREREQIGLKFERTLRTATISRKRLEYTIPSCRRDPYLDPALPGDSEAYTVRFAGFAGEMEGGRNKFVEARVKSDVE